MDLHQKQEKDRFFAAGKLCHPRLFRQSGGMDLCKNIQVFFDIIDSHVYAV
jgi:hypothetical protein